jgi:hypothetical protein
MHFIETVLKTCYYCETGTAERRSECLNLADCRKLFILTRIWSGGKRLLAGEQANLFPNGRCWLAWSKTLFV